LRKSFVVIAGNIAALRRVVHAVPRRLSSEKGKMDKSVATGGRGRDEKDMENAKPQSLEDELGIDRLTERVGMQQRMLGHLRKLFAEGQYRDMDLEPPPEDAWYPA
jgi:hypothetical protein